MKKPIFFDSLNKKNNRKKQSGLILAKPGKGRHFQIDYKKILIEELVKRIEMIKENK